MWRRNQIRLLSPAQEKLNCEAGEAGLRELQEERERYSHIICLFLVAEEANVTYACYMYNTSSSEFLQG
jgi:hypothetical protein